MARVEEGRVVGSMAPRWQDAGISERVEEEWIESKIAVASVPAWVRIAVGPPGCVERRGVTS